MDPAPSALSMGVTGGLIALAAALLVATAVGFTLRRRAGRFRPARPGTGLATLGSAIPEPGRSAK